MDHARARTVQEPFEFRVIGAMKLASAVMLALAGVGMFRLLHEDIGRDVERFVTRLHLDPENLLVHEAVSRISGVSPAQLELIGAGTFFYAVLHLIEGTGLLLGRTWAGYFTVVITGSLLPLELYEVAKKPTPVRAAVLATNLAIVGYLAYKLVQERRARRQLGASSPR